MPPLTLGVLGIQVYKPAGVSLVVVGGAQPLEKKPCMLGMHGTERWVSDFLLPLGSREVGGSSDFLLPLGDVGGYWKAALLV